MRLHEGKLPPKLRAGEIVALDLEMFNQDKRRLHRPHGDFACLSAAVGDDVYQVYSAADAGEMLRRVDKGEWVLQKGDYDFRQLRGLGLSVPPRRYWDTMYVEQALFSGWYNRFGLDSLSRRWLQKPLDKEARDLFTAARCMTKEMKRYAARDAFTTFVVASKQARYAAENDFSRLIERVWFQTDMPALWAILDMRGVTLDSEAWLKLAAKNRALMAEGKAKLDFDPGSNKRVAEVLLAAGVKLPKTDKGNYSTKDDVIAPYADDYEVVRTVLDYREAQKQAGTYGERFVEWVEADGRLHPCFNLNGAVTSRLSSENPCVNVPKKPETVGKLYRSCFVPAPGHVFVKMDYVQCQVYVLAHVAQDQPMIEALKAGQDIHQANAAWLYGVPYEDVRKDQRKHAKGVTFGIMFNEGAGALADKENIPRTEAKRFIDAFFAGHPGVNAWANRQRAMQDFVETPGGRRIWLNPYTGKHGENVAMNYPIQAGEAEIHKRMLAKMHRRWPPEWGQFGACILAHDEILTEVERKHARACAKLVRECALEAEAELLPSVPPAAEVEIVKNWWGDPVKEKK